MRTHSHSFAVMLLITGTVRPSVKSINQITYRRRLHKVAHRIAKLRRSTIHSQHRLFREVAFNLTPFSGTLHSPLKHASSAPRFSRHSRRWRSMKDSLAEPNIELAIVSGNGFNTLSIDAAVKIDMPDAPVVHRLLPPGRARDVSDLPKRRFLRIDAVFAKAPFCAAQTIAKTGNGRKHIGAECHAVTGI